MEMQDTLLFNRPSINEVKTERLKSLTARVARATDDELADADFAERLVKENDLPVPTVKESEIKTSSSESQVWASHGEVFGRDIPEGSLIPAKFAHYHVPYEGDGRQFQYQPTTCRLGMPQAQIAESELVLTYRSDGRKAADVKMQFEGDLENIRINLTALESDCADFKSTLQDEVRRAAAAEAQRRANDSAFMDGLGYERK